MDDPSQYSIAGAAKSHLPIFIPWQRERMSIGRGFDSTALEGPGDPWKTAFPFLGNNAVFPECQAMLEPGIGRDTQGHSSSNSTTSEHFSGILGVSVGNAVAKVGVTANYDRQMQEIANASRASHNVRLRCGRLALVEDPPLSPAARAILHCKDGARQFAELFGDYYVAGFVTGADSGGCLVALNSAKLDVETITTTVNVNILWVDFADSSSKTNLRHSCSVDLEFHGFDSLEATTTLLHAEPGKPTENIRNAALSCVKNTQTIHQRLQTRIERLDIGVDGTISHQQCVKAIEMGIVVELMLIPFETLKEYVVCKLEGIRNCRTESLRS